MSPSGRPNKRARTSSINSNCGHESEDEIHEMSYRPSHFCQKKRKSVFCPPPCINELTLFADQMPVVPKSVSPMHHAHTPACTCCTSYIILWSPILLLNVSLPSFYPRMSSTVTISGGTAKYMIMVHHVCFLMLSLIPFIVRTIEWSQSEVKTTFVRNIFVQAPRRIWIGDCRGSNVFAGYHSWRVYH